MKKLLVLVSVLSLSGCGGSEEGTLQIRLDAASRSEIGGFQIAVYDGGCEGLQRKCIADISGTRESLPIRIENGAESPAVFLATGTLNEVAPGTSTFSREATELRIPAGKDLGLVIEALSSGSPAQFLGSSCTLIGEVSTGRNSAVLAAPIELNADPASCSKSPRVAP